MKFNVLYLFLIASISGVICDSDDPAIIINKKNHTDVPTASTVPGIDPNSTTTIAPTTTTVPTTTTTSTPPTTTNTPAPTPANVTTTTIAPIPTTNATTLAPTTIPTISTSTESTTSVPTTAPSHKGRKFDGPSFIGGIILSSGLMAIGFVSWKFYKARTERNYHTL